MLSCRAYQRPSQDPAWKSITRGAPDREWRPLPHPTVNLPGYLTSHWVGGQTRKTRDKLNLQQVAGSVSHLAGRLPHPHEQGRKSGHTGAKGRLPRAPSPASGSALSAQPRGGKAAGPSEISRPLASWTSAPGAQLGVSPDHCFSAVASH